MAACRYAELAARIALIRTGRPPVVPAPAGDEQAPHRVRTVDVVPGITSYTVAEVCVWHAEVARQNLPGFIGHAMTIPESAPSRPAVST